MPIMDGRTKTWVETEEEEWESFPKRPYKKHSPEAVKKINSRSNNPEIRKNFRCIRRKVLSKDKPLKRKYFLACENYLRGMSQREAVEKAGFAAKSAVAIFDRPEVVEYIERRRDVIRRKTDNLTKKIMEELSHIAFFSIGDIMEVTEDGELVYNFTKVGYETMSAVAEVTTDVKMVGGKRVKTMKVKPHNKMEALQLLARINGMFHDTLTLVNGGSVEEKLIAGRERVAGQTIDAEPEEWETIND